jgi:mercuric reductase
MLAATGALKAGMTVDDLANTCGPYLTMAESLPHRRRPPRQPVAHTSCCA